MNFRLTLPVLVVLTTLSSGCGATLAECSNCTDDASSASNSTTSSEPGNTVASSGGPSSTPSADPSSTSAATSDDPTTASTQTATGASTGTCQPQCSGRTCGPDGCGGNCGSCSTGQKCTPGGTCAQAEPVCVPQCNGRTCGPDGCGGTCGTCPGNSTCNAAQTACTCNEGFVPNATGTQCVGQGSACGNIDKWGTCSGDVWLRCDGKGALQAIDCGPGNCATIDSAGHGACTCGNINENGVCAASSGADGNTTHFACLSNLGVLYADDCQAITGRSTGLCNTYVTEFGHATSCVCDPCSYWDDGGKRCVPLCPTGQCQYNATLGFSQCL